MAWVTEGMSAPGIKAGSGPPGSRAIEADGVGVECVARRSRALGEDGHPRLAVGYDRGVRSSSLVTSLSAVAG